MYFSLCSTTRQILRDAQNDKMIESSCFDTLSKMTDHFTTGSSKRVAAPS
jgi:hypothetical protein